jgi:subfamily B ATP-binding cassette protein MsbA
MVSARFDTANSQVLYEELRIRTARAITSPITETLAILVLMILALIAARQILDGNMSFDSFMLSLTALGVAGASLRPLTGIVNDVQAAVPPYERLQEIIGKPNEVALTADFPPLAKHSKSITFDGVLYRYPNAEFDALRGVNIHILRGEHVAFVGSNGCGKTTLLSMLPSLLQPTEGRVLIDGTDISTVRLGTLREQIGVVTQDAVLIRASVRDNITFGREGGEDQVRAAAARAHAINFIEELPDGFDTVVAEGGTSLSGGQRQRIAIARALFRDPEILVLDEATSQIDSESESQINAAIAECGEGRTSLVIAHRMSTVLAADRIVVMNEGCVVGVGTHAELLESCPAYEAITRNQLTAT